MRIEYKFLLNVEQAQKIIDGKHYILKAKINQFYLATDPEIRYREMIILDDNNKVIETKYYFTSKMGESPTKEVTNLEITKELYYRSFILVDHILTKTRYYLDTKNVFEKVIIDSFDVMDNQFFTFEVAVDNIVDYDKITTFYPELSTVDITNRESFQNSKIYKRIYKN